MSTTIVIPARYESSRFPGKPLAVIPGPDGDKTLLERTVEVARAAQEIAPWLIRRILVATDDHRVSDLANHIGVEYRMVTEECANGTDRISRVARMDAASILNPDGEEEIYINLQGDSPLTNPQWIVDMAEVIEQYGNVICTVALKAHEDAIQRMRLREAAGVGSGETTVVMNHEGQALYFSKRVLPYGDLAPVYQHVGLYGYRASMLYEYRYMAPGPLERTEGLEQLRFLENGVPINCLIRDPQDHQELNNPEDIETISRILFSRIPASSGEDAQRQQ